MEEGRVDVNAQLKGASIHLALHSLQCAPSRAIDTWIHKGQGAGITHRWCGRGGGAVRKGGSSYVRKQAGR